MHEYDTSLSRHGHRYKPRPFICSIPVLYDIISAIHFFFHPPTRTEKDIRISAFISSPVCPYRTCSLRTRRNSLSQRFTTARWALVLLPFSFSAVFFLFCVSPPLFPPPLPQRRRLFIFLATAAAGRLPRKDVRPDATRDVRVKSPAPLPAEAGRPVAEFVFRIETSRECSARVLTTVAADRQAFAAYTFPTRGNRVFYLRNK